MERGRHAALATFHAPSLHAGEGRVALDEDAAHHARVRRLAVGERVRLTSGAGAVAEGTIARLAKATLEVELDEASRREVVRPPAVHLLVPVADRERMLWLAEKAAELAVTSWVPVVYARSRSVAPRGEGASFADKVRRRMIAALEQSAGAWLPAVEQEVDVQAAVARFDDCQRLILDAAGDPVVPGLFSPELHPGVAMAVGPEGGFAPEELDAFRSGGWRPMSLAPTVLRFETAGVAALAVARASLAVRMTGMISAQRPR